MLYRLLCPSCSALHSCHSVTVLRCLFHDMKNNTVILLVLLVLMSRSFRFSRDVIVDLWQCFRQLSFNQDLLCIAAKTASLFAWWEQTDVTFDPIDPEIPCCSCWNKRNSVDSEGLCTYSTWGIPNKLHQGLIYSKCRWNWVSSISLRLRAFKHAHNSQMSFFTRSLTQRM